MRSLTSYDYRAIARNALVRAGWALRPVTEEARVWLCSILVLLMFVWSIPLLLLELLIAVIRPKTHEFTDPFNVP
jgi:hypothetical protein